MTSKLQLITIVTATYGRFDRLYETIDSVLNQDYPNIEYIITDDGSLNFPEEEIRLYIESRKKADFKYLIIHHDKNIGTVKNLNYAYHKASGVYISNLSCGDVFFDDCVITKLVKRFKVTSGNVIVTSRILYKGNFEPLCLLPHFDERRILISKYDSGIDQYKALITSYYYDMASGSAMSFTKEILVALNYYDEKYKLWEDGPFLAKYLQNDKLTYAYDIVSTWYEAGGISSSSKKDHLDQASTPGKYYLDIQLFNKGDRIKRMDLFSRSEKRKIFFSCRMHESYFSPIGRLFQRALYLPEFISWRKYKIDRKARINDDLIEIQKLLVERHTKYSELEENTET